MKRFFGRLAEILGYWIMWLGLFALICPFLFPFPMWPELKNIFNIVVFVFPIGFVLRFIGMYKKDDIFGKLLYMIKDTFVILVFVTLPSIAIPIVYLIHHNTGQIAILKGLILLAIGIIGYILMVKYIKDTLKKLKKQSKKRQTDD